MCGCILLSLHGLSLCMLTPPNDVTNVLRELEMRSWKTCLGINKINSTYTVPEGDSEVHVQ